MLMLFPSHITTEGCDDEVIMVTGGGTGCGGSGCNSDGKDSSGGGESDGGDSDGGG